MSVVLVHGGGGFLGRAIVQAVAAAPGLEPVACVRRAPPQPLGAAHQFCDATDAGAMLLAARGATYAVNAVLGDGPTMLEATRTVCRTARQTGLRRIVHISTMSVYGTAEGVVSEGDALEPANAGSYGAAKIGCEAIIRDFMADGGEAVILRPGIVYGVGGQQWAGRLGRMLLAGRLGDLGVGGDGLCNLIHHHDVGAAVVAALTQRGAAGQTINLGPVAPPTWNDVFRRFGAAIGATPLQRITARRLRAEAWLLASPLQVAKRAALRLGMRPGALPEPMPPSLLSLWRQRIALDPTRADALLGLVRTSPRVGLAECAGWFMRGAR